MQLLLRWAISAVALYGTVLICHYFHLRVWLAPGVGGAVAALIAVALLAVVNTVIRPIVKLVTFPLTCLTFGLFSFVVNGLMFWIVGQVVPGFRVKGFEAPVVGSIMMSLLFGILNYILIPDDEKGKNK
jgi:putative membrane protein